MAGPEHPASLPSGGSGTDQWNPTTSKAQVKCLFPTCQVRVVRFYVWCAAPPSFSSSFLLLAGPHLPALDRSGPRRTSSASSWSRWASPDLHCQLWIAVGLAGPQPARVNRRESESCGPRRTSTGVGLAGPQLARFGALWASPDLNRRDSARRGPRRTSTATNKDL